MTVNLEGGLPGQDGYVVNNHSDGINPLFLVGNGTPSKWPKSTAEINGVILSTYKSCDDPPRAWYTWIFLLCVKKLWPKFTQKVLAKGRHFYRSRRSRYEWIFRGDPSKQNYRHLRWRSKMTFFCFWWSFFFRDGQAFNVGSRKLGLDNFQRKITFQSRWFFLRASLSPNIFHPESRGKKNYQTDWPQPAERMQFSIGTTSQRWPMGNEA